MNLDSHPRLDWLLDNKEPIEIRNFVKLLQVKQPMLKRSFCRRWFNLKRDNQIKVLKQRGYEYAELCDLARKYRCIWEMFE